MKFLRAMGRRYLVLTAAFIAGLVVAGGSVRAADLSFVSGAVGNSLKFYEKHLPTFEARTGHKVTLVPMPASTTDMFGQYRLWLAAGSSDIDVYQTDVIWAPQLATQLVDLKAAAAGVTDQHFSSTIESQTVNGRLVALPAFTDAPALYYRKDLLEKYNKPVPTTWEELSRTARDIQDAEREAGNPDMWGFVWQGNAYEGLTCDALEWVKSHGGGQIVEADGTISVNNPAAALAINRAKSWVGEISPPGVLSYQEEEARGVWQTGNAVFMRNWPYAYALGNGDDSVIRGKFDVAPLPSAGGTTASAATLGGWNVAVSKYSRNKEAAIALALFISSEEFQKLRALELAQSPTVISLYDDPEVAAAQPIVLRWKDMFLNAVPRPSAPTKIKYNEVSSLFWSAVHDTLSGRGTAEENLEVLEVKLEDLKGSAW